MKNKFYWLVLVYTLTVPLCYAQDAGISGRVMHGNEPLGFANIGIVGTTWGTTSNDSGYFYVAKLDAGTYTLLIQAIGFEKLYRKIQVKAGQLSKVNIQLEPTPNTLNEVTVTGTMKEATKLNTPVAIEVYSPKFFQKNVSNNLFDALSMVNGVQPTMNCNVCNTGDIHINGMEGPYTLILIDGMPIVSALSTVYGMMGIPNSMVDRVEVIKGPASTLYGSEAVAGIINVITKNPSKAPKVSFDVFGTSYQEFNSDVSFKWKMKKTDALFSANYFNLNKPWDKNNDGFTDVTLQNRISLFNKYRFTLKNNTQANIAFRYFYEDRWGGQTNWNNTYRGGDSVYGESIYTSRMEAIGNYQFPAMPNLKLMYSYNLHQQNSYYGTTFYLAKQHVGFGQLVYNKKYGARHDVLGGLALRYTYYDDNSPATADLSLNNKPAMNYLPGLFLQDEISIHSTQTLLLGLRYDYFKDHGSIVSPRVNFKWQPNRYQTIRLSGGNGFRVVNLFTEDHAALSGARQVVIKEELKPEQSWNTNLNYTRFISFKKGFVNLDATAFYTYFTNRIIADYDTDPNQIIYDNLKGYAISRGISLNAEVSVGSAFKLNIGSTFMQVYQKERDSLNQLQKTQQIHAPNYSGTFQLSYTFARFNLTIDYTGQVYGPMRLPVLVDDFRPEYSPWFTLQNVQVTKRINQNWQVYGGVKNLFNFIPDNPIMRPFDPFDKRTQENNPNGYTFDPSYNYAPIQGVRLLVGVRFTLF